MVVFSSLSEREQCAMFVDRFSRFGFPGILKCAVVQSIMSSFVFAKMYHVRKFFAVKK